MECLAFDGIFLNGKKKRLVVSIENFEICLSSINRANNKITSAKIAKFENVIVQRLWIFLKRPFPGMRNQEL